MQSAGEKAAASAADDLIEQSERLWEWVGGWEASQRSEKKRRIKSGERFFS
jgi:hypothetical protein